jgi:hypothetical protein
MNVMKLLGTPFASACPRYVGTRVRVEARAALQQAEELRRVIEELGVRLGG